MARNSTLFAVLVVVGSASAAAAQVSSGPATGPAAPTAPRASSTAAPDAGVEPSTPTAAEPSSVPSPATNPNSQVAPSAAGLPGGGGNVPGTPGSGIGEEVPIYDPANNSGMARPIDESEQRSSSTACDATGTQASSGSGSTSTTRTDCEPSRGLTSIDIMGGSGTIDVSRP